MGDKNNTFGPVYAQLSTSVRSWGFRYSIQIPRM
ncbi:hypothetical protein KM92DES2_11791 [uncultured Desulfovibrio sp.]|uniref:Uncharacterized protein n=1 Tax=uncultured Desulfovibrio sp. TaxID=167968 RepID=A0A212JVC8_9BACT|nr:hypothetical protein KM92DES2_11791 [uncultured Desulfovibrio sp.]